MGYLIDILIGAASRIVTGELSAHAVPLARWIIEKAVERLPTDDREKFREEWIAHLDETQGTLGKLWHALGCHLAAGKFAAVFAQQANRRATSKRGITIVLADGQKPKRGITIALADGEKIYVTGDEEQARFIFRTPHHGSRNTPKS